MRLIDLVKNMVLATLFLVLIITNILLWLPFVTNEYESAKVLGESMTPTLRPGDYLILKHVNFAEIEIGDILTIKYDYSSLTHRLIEKIERTRAPNYIRLKGDGNEEPDPGRFDESKIIGKVVLVLPLSHLYTTYGFTLAIVIPFSLIVHRLREGRKQMQDEITLLLSAILSVSLILTISHYFLIV